MGRGPTTVLVERVHYVLWTKSRRPSPENHARPSTTTLLWGHIYANVQSTYSEHALQPQVACCLQRVTLS
jgi:hypothetical protein